MMQLSPECLQSYKWYKIYFLK